MKKKLLFIVLLLVTSIVIQIIFKRISMLCIILDFLILIYILGMIIEKKFLDSRIPNIMTSKRNYDKLLLGNERDIKNIDIDLDNTLIMTNYDRNLYVDFLILQRYYSFLRIDGECEFICDFNNYKYFNSNKIDSLDYDFLHIVTLYENGVNVKSIKYKFKKLLNKYKYVYYKLGIYNKFYRKINYEDLVNKMHEINIFAKERSIYIKISAKNLNYDIKQKFSNISFNKI